MVVSIKDLFAKYLTLVPKEKNIKDALIVAIQKITNLSILATEIKIQSTTAFIQTHPLVKKEIFSKKNEVLEEVERILSKKTITTIQ